MQHQKFVDNVQYPPFAHSWQTDPLPQQPLNAIGNVGPYDYAPQQRYFSNYHMGITRLQDAFDNFYRGSIPVPRIPYGRPYVYIGSGSPYIIPSQGLD